MVGTRQTGIILDRIVADKRESLRSAQSKVSQRDLRNFYEGEVHGDCTLGPQWGLRNAIALGPRLLLREQRGPKLICEIKVASPSKGRLVQSTGGGWAQYIARTYTEGGACAISVITEGSHFFGKLDYMSRVRSELKRRFPISRPSILRKDFLFDEYQIWEARANGADAVLLIAAILEGSLLQSLINLAESIGMDALVEVHDEGELGMALRAGAKIIGINNRDLRTFKVDLSTTERLRLMVPSGKLVVSESGIHTGDDVERLAECGVHAILVGEALVTASDIHAKMRELII